MIRELANGRLLGHPVHAMLVHFPTALFSFSFVCDLWGKVAQNPDIYRSSLISMSLGLVLGLLAAVFGVIDYLKLTERNELFQKASWHAGIQLSVLMVFGVITGVRITDYPLMPEPGIAQLIITGVTVAAMLAGNYLGGDLVFRHGVGVRRQ